MSDIASSSSQPSRPHASQPSFRHVWCNPWSLSLAIIALLLASPIMVVLASLAQPFSGTWQHLARTVLPDYIANSLLLMLGVSLGVMLLGVSTAWLVVMCRFPARAILQWALLLPLAIPAYILAYTYTDFLQYAGPLQSWLREIFGWTRHDYVFPEIRSRGGAVLMLTLALYPYVYLLSRNSFREQSHSLLEASRSLGLGAWRTFWRVCLPLARPSIVAGVSLALMETLSDYGTVEYFGVSTFTTGIYRTWFGMGEPVTAAQLASLLLIFVSFLFVLEQRTRRRSRYQKQPSQSRYRSTVAYPLRGLKAGCATLWCALPVFVGFLFPFALLLRMAWRQGDWFERRLLLYAQHSLLVASISALLAVILSLIIAYAIRLRPTPLNHGLSRIAALGYAIPGSVIAVGILLSFAYVQRLPFVNFMLIGSIAGLILAYLTRFLAVSLGGIQSSLNKITANMDDAARSLGRRSGRILLRVHIPLLRGSLLSAGLLVFVDVIKELPATLIARPSNFDTLATRVYRLASDERLMEASSGALAIVLIGIVPVIILMMNVLEADDAVSSSHSN